MSIYSKIVRFIVDHLAILLSILITILWVSGHNNTTADSSSIVDFVDNWRITFLVLLFVQPVVSLLMMIRQGKPLLYSDYFYMFILSIGTILWTMSLG